MIEQKRSSFKPIFYSKNRAQAHFYLGFEEIPKEKAGKKPKYVGKKPTFKTKSGQKKPSICKGFSDFSPLSHFFS